MGVVVPMAVTVGVTVGTRWVLWRRWLSPSALDGCCGSMAVTVTGPMVVAAPRSPMS
jgi:hypothetical protein